MNASRSIFRYAGWIFLIGVLIQVFLAGLVVVARQSDWENHISLGHALGLFLLVMLITMYTGRLSGDVKRLTWVLFVVYALGADVVIFLRQDAPFISALHPVIAVLDFALAWAVIRRLNANSEMSAA